MRRTNVRRFRYAILPSVSLRMRLIGSGEGLEDLLGGVGIDGCGKTEFRFELDEGGLDLGEGVIRGEAGRFE